MEDEEIIQENVYIDWIKENKLELAILIISLIILIYSLYKIGNTDNCSTEEFEEENISDVEKTEEIYIDVSGEVKNPNVYKMPKNTRLQEVIIKAGGFTENVDKDFFEKNYNKAKIIEDEEKIYIPSIYEVENDLYGKEDLNISSFSTNVSISSQISINNATKEDLESLSGIGEKIAQKIIDARPFSTLEDLTNRKIISQSLFEKIKNLISL